MDLTNLYKILPSPTELKKFDKIKEGSHLILAAGFEDRARGFIEGVVSAKSFKNKITSVSLINYLPKNVNNETNKDKILKILLQLSVTPQNINEQIFDREHPLDFENSYDNLFSSIKLDSYVYVDISAMSKLLILYVLYGLWKKNVSFSVVYSEANEYAPTYEQFLESFKKGDFGQELLIELQSVGAFEPIIPLEFSGNTPMGGGRALIDFLGFNKRQSIGVVSIVPYQFFIPIVGVPPSKELQWRQEALIMINNTGLLTSGKKIQDLIQLQITDKDIDKAKESEYRIHVSTFDYKETIKALLWIYEAHKFSHYLTIAPFGSKMQTLGIFIFTRLHPETQIVYASPKDFHPQYTQGIRATFEINFEKILELEKDILRSVDPDSKRLGNLLDKIE